MVKRIATLPDLVSRDELSRTEDLFECRCSLGVVQSMEYL